MTRRVLFPVVLACLATLLPVQGACVAEPEALRIVAGPYLQNVTPEAATAIWFTNTPCVSWVDFGSDESLGRKAVNARHGLIDAGVTIHRVRLTGLEPGRPCYYRVVSRAIARFMPYQVDFGETVTSSTTVFTPPTPDAGHCSFVVFNDVHNSTGAMDELFPMIAPLHPELVFLNGDIMSHLQDEASTIRYFAEPFGRLTEGRVPLVFARGNHETRGVYARDFFDYLDTSTGQYYDAFTWGPVRFLVLDTGEDKPDDHEEYFGLVAFDRYLDEETEWLKKEVALEPFRDAAFRVIVAHIPIEAGPCWEKWGAILNESAIDLQIAGHYHDPKILQPDAARRFPIVIGGGPDPGIRTLIHVEADAKELTARVLRRDDGVFDRISIQAKSISGS